MKQFRFSKFRLANKCKVGIYKTGITSGKWKILSNTSKNIRFKDHLQFSLLILSLPMVLFETQGVTEIIA